MTLRLYEGFDRDGPSPQDLIDACVEFATVAPGVRHEPCPDAILATLQDPGVDWAYVSDGDGLAGFLLLAEGRPWYVAAESGSWGLEDIGFYVRPERRHGGRTADLLLSWAEVWSRVQSMPLSIGISSGERHEAFGRMMRARGYAECARMYRFEP